MTECYMCSAESVSVEHVPPKCLFPEKKDLSGELDFRKQLITVPSCEIHNGHKSQDDEYLLYVLAMNYPANSTALDHFNSKLMRAINRNPILLNKITKDHKSLTLVDPHTGKTNHTAAFRIDEERFDNIIDSMVRALYFHHFGKKWHGEILASPCFIVYFENEKRNQQVHDLETEAKKVFQNREFFGENPEVFKYQVIDDVRFCEIIFRLSFYGECNINCCLGLKG